MSITKMTAEESCRQVLKTIADACDQEALARAGGYLFRYVREETVLRDCGQHGVCRTPPGCARHWEERNRELARENEALRANNESMARHIESLAEELAKPEDVRLREVLEALAEAGDLSRPSTRRVLAARFLAHGVERRRGE